LWRVKVWSNHKREGNDMQRMRVRQREEEERQETSHPRMAMNVVI